MTSSAESPFSGEQLQINANVDLNKTVFEQICNQSDWVSEAKKDFSYTFFLFFGIPASFIICVTVLGNLLVLCFKVRFMPTVDALYSS